MTMHTKGKWKLFIGKCGDIIEIQDAHGKPIVGWGGFDDSRRSLEEHQANARLMAEAPNMLETLERIERADTKGFIDLKRFRKGVTEAIREVKEEK